MRVLFEVRPASSRGLLGQVALEAKPLLPRGPWRLPLVLAGFGGGALLFALYVWLMLHSRAWPLYVIYAAAGGCLGVMAVTLPRLAGHFLSKQWHRLLLKHYSDRDQVLATAARRRVAEVATEGDRNDRAVVAFLQGEYGPAADTFVEAIQEGQPQAIVNLLAALSELGAWDRVCALLAENLPAVPSLATNLARIAALTPDASTLSALHQVSVNLLDPMLLNNLGVRALEAGDFTSARQALATAVKQRTTYPPALANQGVLAYREGFIARAVTALSSASALSANPLIFSNLGAALAHAGETRAALEWLTRAERLHPRHPGIQVNLGNAYAQDGKIEEALEALNSAAHLGEYQATAYHNMALVLLQQDEYEQAMAALREGEALAPDDPDIQNNIGCLHFAAKRYEEAVACFARFQQARAIGSFPHNLVRAQLALGQIDEVKARLERSSETGPDTALERGLLSLLTALEIEPTTETYRQMRLHNLREAARGFQSIITAGQGPVTEASFNLALGQYLQGEYRTAGDTCAATLKQHPEQIDMHYLAGMCYVMAGLREHEQHEGADGEVAPLARELFLLARPHFEKVLDHPGLGEAAAHDLGLMYYILADYSKALEVFRRVIRADSPPWIINALALAEARRAQELQFQAQTATLMAENRKQQIRQEARTLLTSAIGYFRQILEIRPDAPLSHANIGLALMLRNDRGDVEKALGHWQRMHQLGDARARQTYERFMESMAPEALQALRFQDVELAFRPLRPREWIALPPPRMAGPRYVVEPIMDLSEWQLYATHPLLKKCLTYRHKAEREREKLRHLAV